MIAPDGADDFVRLRTGRVEDRRCREVDAELRDDRGARFPGVNGKPVVFAQLFSASQIHNAEVVRRRRRGLSERVDVAERCPRVGANRRRLRGERHLVNAAVVGLRDVIEG